jgi:ribosomal protein S18 acetylase RimI-like enzyme
VTVTTRRAGAADVDAVAPLFCAYLDFYECPAEIEDVRRYLAARIDGGDSVIHLAESEAATAPLGFTQCYPNWSSLDLAPMWVLEDLYVAVDARRGGVAVGLLEATVAAAREAGACRVALETQHSNAPAIALYERTGFTREAEFATYEVVFESG